MPFNIISYCYMSSWHQVKLLSHFCESSEFNHAHRPPHGIEYNSYAYTYTDFFAFCTNFYNTPFEIFCARANLNVACSIPQSLRRSTRSTTKISRRVTVKARVTDPSAGFKLHSLNLAVNLK